METAVFWDVTPCSLIRTNISKGHITSFFMAEEYSAMYEEAVDPSEILLCSI